MANLYFKIVERLSEYIKYSNTRVHNLNLGEFKNELLVSNAYQPVFFLSTGRTGTQLFTNILNKSKGVKTFHSPKPELIGQSKYAYEVYAENNFLFDHKRYNSLAQILLTAREELLYKTYLHGLKYIETNNRISFFAPAIKQLIPNAKFVYTYRHPGEFVRSGIRRNWYSDNHPHDHGRIAPTESSAYFDDWKNFDSIQKISWLWNETNTFIEKYLNTLPGNDYIKFNFNDLEVEKMKEILKFLDIDLAESLIENSLNKKVNVQQKGTFPEYNEWPEEDKLKLKQICGELAGQYGYIL